MRLLTPELNERQKLDWEVNRCLLLGPFIKAANNLVKRGINYEEQKNITLHIISCYRHPFNHRLRYA